MMLHLKRFIIANRLLSDSLWINLLYLLYLYRKHCIISRGGHCAPHQLFGHKKSETLIILGAGPSINEVPIEAWGKMTGVDIAGLSYSCLLPVRQTFYFYESPFDRSEKLMAEHILRLMPAISEARNAGRLPMCIWKNPESYRFGRLCDMDSFTKLQCCNILTDSPVSLGQVLRFILKHELHFRVMFQKRGSVFAVALFAIMLKYRHVIFCGIDLYNTVYFFEDKIEFKRYGLTNPFELESQKLPSLMHGTNDPSLGIPIQDALGILTQLDHDTDFFVSSPHSRLARFLPIWQLN